MSELCFLESKFMQIEMIKRHYTNYQEEQYVLWIVPELFHNTEATSIISNLKIILQDGNSMDMNFKIISCTPYPNKNIIHLAMKSGRKRIYGIPLVFNTFEELCRISSISIRWDIFNKDETSRIDRLIVNYNLNFKNDIKNRFFTVFSKDTICDVEKEEYYSQFDTINKLEEIESSSKVSLHLYQKNETLQAESLFNIIPEPMFGFKEVNRNKHH